MKRNSAARSGAVLQNRERELHNRFEHHVDIKKNPLVPFKAIRSSNCRNISCNWHDNLELLLFSGGSGILHYGTQDIRVSPGTLVIVNSQTMHSMATDKGVDFYTIIIDNSFFAENGIDVSGYAFRQVTGDAEIIRLCTDAYREYGNLGGDADALTVARVRRAFLSLIIELCASHIVSEHLTEDSPCGSEKYVKEAMEYINDNYTRKITLDGIARVIGINKSYFAREFRRYAGQTVHTYINHLRCTRADRCLAEGLSVTDAAMEAGFGTLSYFSRTYKKLRGVSPVCTKGKFQ